MTSITLSDEKIGGTFARPEIISKRRKRVSIYRPKKEKLHWTSKGKMYGKSSDRLERKFVSGMEFECVDDHISVL